jgi:GT2 family glycosyltransferase
LADSLVTIVIVNFETSEYVNRCLASLSQQTQAHEVIVVDNASPANDWQKVETLGAQLLRSSDNLGYGRACNVGAQVRSAGSRFICILNPDTVVPAGALELWTNRYHELLPEGGILAPALLNENGMMQRSAYSFPGFLAHWPNNSIFAGALKARRKKYDSIKQSRAATQPRTVDWVMGAAMLLDTDTWDALGGFSDDYFLYAEDTDLCYRCHQMGRPVIYDPQIQLYHTQGEAPAERRHVAMAMLFSGLRIFSRKHYNFRQRLGVNCAVVLDMLLRMGIFTAAVAVHPRSTLHRNRLRGAFQVLGTFLTGRPSLDAPLARHVLPSQNSPGGR